MSFNDIIGIDEELPVTVTLTTSPLTFPTFGFPFRLLFTPTALQYLSIYPTIGPGPLFASRAHEGKVVLVTGASQGIGQD